MIHLSLSETFEPAVKSLQKNKAVLKIQSLASLGTFLDQQEVLRVWGNLEAADILYYSKHLVYLHRKS